MAISAQAEKGMSVARIGRSKRIADQSSMACGKCWKIMVYRKVAVEVELVGFWPSECSTHNGE